MNRSTAQQIEAIMRDVSSRINQSIQLVMDSSSHDEFQNYRRSAGKIMGEIYLDILKPLYAEYPDLVPPEMKQL